MLAQPFEIVAHRIIFRPPLTRSCTFGLDPYPFFSLFFQIYIRFFRMIDAEGRHRCSIFSDIEIKGMKEAREIDTGRY